MIVQIDELHKILEYFSSVVVPFKSSGRGPLTSDSLSGQGCLTTYTEQPKQQDGRRGFYPDCSFVSPPPHDGPSRVRTFGEQVGARDVHADANEHDAGGVGWNVDVCAKEARGQSPCGGEKGRFGQQAGAKSRRVA